MAVGRILGAEVRTLFGEVIIATVGGTARMHVAAAAGHNGPSGWFGVLGVCVFMPHSVQRFPGDQGPTPATHSPPPVEWKHLSKPVCCGRLHPRVP